MYGVAVKLVKENSVSQEEQLNTLALKYKLSKNFSSSAADGAWVLGPLGSKEKFTILFYSDAVTLTEQPLDPLEDGSGYVVNNTKASFLNFREHTARVSMDLDTIISLRNAIDTQLDKAGITIEKTEEEQEKDSENG